MSYASQLLATGTAFTYSQSAVYSTGVQFITQGERPTDVYYVIEGLIKLTHMQASGEERVLILCGPGQVLGAESAILNDLHDENAITITKSRLAMWSVDVFLRNVAADPIFSANVLRTLSTRHAIYRRRITSLCTRDVEERLATLITQELGGARSGARSKPKEFPLCLDREDLTQILSVSRCHLSRVLTKLVNEGKVVRRGHQLFWLA